MSNYVFESHLPVILFIPNEKMTISLEERKRIIWWWDLLENTDPPLNMAIIPIVLPDPVIQEIKTIKRNIQIAYIPENLFIPNEKL